MHTGEEIKKNTVRFWESSDFFCISIFNTQSSVLFNRLWGQGELWGAEGTHLPQALLGYNDFTTHWSWISLSLVAKCRSRRMDLLQVWGNSDQNWKHAHAIPVPSHPRHKVACCVGFFFFCSKITVPNWKCFWFLFCFPFPLSLFFFFKDRVVPFTHCRISNTTTKQFCSCHCGSDVSTVGLSQKKLLCFSSR